MLLARIYEVFPLMCPLCGAQMRIIAFVTDPSNIRDILHLSELIAAPRIAPARGPPLWDLSDVRTGDCDPHAQMQDWRRAGALDIRTASFLEATPIGAPIQQSAVFASRESVILLTESRVANWNP